MSEVKKIATRESYGNALVELGEKSMKIWSYWTQTWPLPPKPVFSRKYSGTTHRLWYR